MALSGSIKTNDYGGRYYTLSWEAVQSIPNNSSTISWVISCAGGTANYYAERTLIAVINGTTVFSKTNRVERYKGDITSGTIEIPHNTDGTKSISMSLQVACYVTTVNLSKSGSFTLDNIPRSATITIAQNFNDEQNPTINYSNPAGNAVSSLQACISLDGTNADVAYRDISKTASTYTFNLTDAERDTLRNGTLTANNRTVRFYVKTVINDETYLSYLEKTLTIVDAKPTLEPTVKDTNATTTALTGDNSKFIKYYSNAEYTVGATTYKGATIKKRNVNVGNKSGTAASGTINGVESATFDFLATDSRGNTVSKTLNKTLINYIKPTCDLVIGAPSSTGELSFTIKGNYFDGSFGAFYNILTVQYCYKKDSGSYGSWTTATATKNGNTYTANVKLTGLDYRAAYTFKARIIDQLNTISSAEKTVKTTPVFDWGADDFKFNVAVSGLEGEWTPTLNASAISSYTTQKGWYIKSGNVITAGFYIKANCRTGYQTTTISIDGLPFNPAYSAAGGGMCSGCYVSSGFTFQCWVAGTDGNITSRVQQVNHTTATNLATSASGCFYRNSGGEITLSGTITYITN